MHATNNGHDGQPPVPGYATTEHTESARVHTRLLDNKSAVARGAQDHLPRHHGHQGRRQRRAHDARRQQVRRVGARGARRARRTTRTRLVMRLHGGIYTYIH